jgi:hypothetical protein
MTQDHLAVMLKVKEAIMIKNGKHKLTLDRPVTYQIKVLGAFDEHWSDWGRELTITIENDDDNLSITTLTGFLDQAALLGLLRRLYSLGVPLISVLCLDFG